MGLGNRGQQGLGGDYGGVLGAAGSGGLGWGDLGEQGVGGVTGWGWHGGGSYGVEEQQSLGVVWAGGSWPARSGAGVVWGLRISLSPLHWGSQA